MGLTSVPAAVRGMSEEASSSEKRQNEKHCSERDGGRGVTDKGKDRERDIRCCQGKDLDSI